MFFDGGIRGFVQDLVLGTEEVAYKATHPRCWETGYTNDDSDINDKKSSPLDEISNIDGFEDLIKLLTKLNDGALTEAEYNDIIDQLNDLEINLKIGDLIAPAKRKPKEKRSMDYTLKAGMRKFYQQDNENDKDSNKVNISKDDEESVKINELEETDEEDRINLKDAIMETPLGKSLFQYIEKEEKKADAAAATASA